MNLALFTFEYHKQNLSLTNKNIFIEIYGFMHFLKSNFPLINFVNVWISLIAIMEDEEKHINYRGNLMCNSALEKHKLSLSPNL